MSLTTSPNSNDFINRIALILQNSAILLPKTIGEDPEATDLVNAIIVNQPPRPEDVLGADAPYVFITKSVNPIIRKDQRGRNSRDAQGPQSITLEFYIIVITLGTDFEESQTQSNDIIQAITTTLDKNKRLTDLTGENPLAASCEWIEIPYLLVVDNKEMVSKNVILRPEVFVNLT